MTDADKITNPQHFGSDPANSRIRIRINPKMRIPMPDHFRLRLGALAEVSLSAVFSAFLYVLLITSDTNQAVAVRVCSRWRWYGWRPSTWTLPCAKQHHHCAGPEADSEVQRHRRRPGLCRRGTAGDGWWTEPTTSTRWQRRRRPRRRVDASSRRINERSLKLQFYNGTLGKSLFNPLRGVYI